jgi:hypothetical protein
VVNLTSNGGEDGFEMKLTLCQSSFNTINPSVCQSYTVPSGDETYTISGTYYDTIPNLTGCDSLITINLTVYSQDATTYIQTACDSYTWIDGNTYTSSNNVATWTLTNASGCDSVVTLNLTINTSTTGTDFQTACDSYTWIDGNTYTSSNNSATWTLTNASGCDSVVTLNLTINTSNTGIDVQTACDSYTWIDGNTYTSSNNSATWTLTNASGCDSVVTLDLTINTSTTGTDVQTACDSYTWIDGNTYTSSNNVAIWTLTNAAGCDSVITLNLTINTSNTGTDLQTACDSYTWIDGNTYTSSNNSATWVLSNTLGCDSIVTLDLTINTSNTGIDVQTACDSYTWIDGNTYTSSNNSATWILSNTSGCDSLVTLNLTINTVNVGVTNNSPILVANSTGTTYQWLNCDDNFAEIPGENNQSFTATVNGNYAVVVSENNCSDTSTCVAVTNVGILENDFGTAFMVFPNPTNGELSVDLGVKYNEVNIIIRNTLGQEVLKKTYSNSKVLQLNIPSESGLYIIEVSTIDKKAQLKVIKE